MMTTELLERCPTLILRKVYGPWLQNGFEWMPILRVNHIEKYEAYHEILAREPSELC